MKKNFVRVMLFGALTLAVSTAVTSCKDYDDDIKGLQEQVDNITSTSPVSTADMNAAVDKASNELKEQLAKLEKLVNDPSSETSLTQQIADLKEALETAVGADAADLAGKLATAQNDLNALKAALGGDDYINGLKSKIEALETAKTTLQNLIAAEAAYQKDNDVSGYKATGLSAYVNAEILAAIAENGNIAVYVDNAVKTAVGTVLADVNTYLSENFEANADLTAFVKKVNETLFSDEYKAQMEKLNLLLTAINKAVGDGSEYADYEAVINQIDATKKQLAALELPSGEGVTFTSAVTAIVTQELATVKTSITSLEEKLQKEIDAIKGMIQSIVYIPESADRTVNFNTFYVKFGAESNASDWQSVVNADEVKVKFRVSPQSAVAELIKGDEGKYSIVTDYHQLTRATGTHFAIKNIEAVTGEPNVIAVTLDATTADKSYAVALTVKDNATATLNDITSDYFAAVKENLYIDAVEWVSANGEVDEVNKGATIDYKAAGSYYKMTVKSEINASGEIQGDALAKTKPEEYGISVDDLFSVEFAKTGSGEASFTIDEETGVLTGNADGTLGNSCQVQSTVIAKNAADPSGTKDKSFTPKTYTEVTLIDIIGETLIALDSSEPLIWNSAEKELDLDAATITEIKTKLGIASFENCTFDPATSSTAPYFTKNSSNELIVKVPAGIAYTGEVTAKVIVGNASITLKTNVAINYPAAADYTLANSNAWDGTTAVLNLATEGSPITAVTAERDLTELFSNYTDLKANLEAIGGEFVFSVVSVEPITGVTINGSTGELSVAKAYTAGGAGFSVKVEAKCGDKVISTKTIPVAFNTTKMNGTFDYSSEEEGGDEMAFDVSDATKRAEAVDVSTKLVWKDASARQLWPVTGASSDYAESKGAEIFGFNVAFELVAGEDNANFSLDTATGKLTLKNPSASQNYKAMTVKVKAVPTSPWGVVEAKVVTVTVATWAD